MKLVLIGAGSRGMIYASYARKKGHEITAVAELRQDRLENAAKVLGVPDTRCYRDGAELLKQGKLGDAAIIATMDRDHYGHVMLALDAGYDILLEKPISPDARECLAIADKADALHRKITVCHVLRYTGFFTKLKEILDSGELGKVVTIKHSENIGNFHMAHSFVRGNWGNSTAASPIIMQKSCHDMDILLWLIGSHCTKAASFGELSYFTPAHAPAGSTSRCLTCPVAESCRFDARKAYLPGLGGWPTDVVCLEQTEEALLKALETSPYGQCVYRCGNDVCDHQSTILEFENGVTATFSLSGMTNRCYRQIHIMCEDGEIFAQDNEKTITVNHFVSSYADGYSQETFHLGTIVGGHGGGDQGIMDDFLAGLQDQQAESRSSISRSVESHLMACAAERSRLTGTVVDLEELKRELRRKA